MNNIREAEEKLDNCIRERRELEQKRNAYQDRFPTDERSLSEREQEHRYTLNKLDRELQEARDKEHEARMERDRVYSNVRKAEDERVMEEKNRAGGTHRETPETERIRFEQWQREKERQQKEIMRQIEEENHKRMQEYLRQSQQNSHGRERNDDSNRRAEEFRNREYDEKMSRLMDRRREIEGRGR